MIDVDFDRLPAPYDALIELGMTHEDIVEALKREPLVVAHQADQQPGAWFDVERARKALQALGAFKHTKGRWAGVRMRLGEGLDSWQVVWVLAPVFGWVYYDEEIERVVRVIRTVWIEIPRKNGKSTFASGISGILLLADGEPGAEVYNAAGSQDQARRVFEDAKTMLRSSPAARKRIEPLKDVVRVPRSNSILRVISSVAETAHGLNVSGATIDEIHTLRLKGKLIEAIETGVGARDQPLIVFITTADEAEEGTPYDEKHNYTRNVSLGIVQDPRFYGVIWAADENDDPFDEETQFKANPGLGKSPTRAYMRDQATKAKGSPAALKSYKQLSLNLRSPGTSRWVDVALWDSLAGAKRTPLRGRRAWGGLDLSATSDFSAWTVWAQSNRPGLAFDLFTRFFVPEERIKELEEQLLVPIQDWVDRGYLTATEGDVVDYSAIKAAVIGDCKHFDMQRIGYDRMFAGQIVQELDSELKGVEIVPVGQGMYGMAPGSKEMERMWKAKEMRHDGNPVMRWMASRVEIKMDDADNFRPVKPNRRTSSARIDGFQAAVTALDGIVRTSLEEKNIFIKTGSNTRRRA
ncbi:terminase TerL endonuclease subunit [Glutamicibacter sp. PS]|uniref:terminase large subunit n=1 Tax=Glutamicibacter sp. PS TaxID=3075634 RepID=UPI002850294E|nr:terminase TerL endonuclease subunit [Glutamicibacter sp. PS]MDR4533222.1 terminase large subunit [Glutamicibacter sp. PS]